MVLLLVQKLALFNENLIASRKVEGYNLVKINVLLSDLYRVFDRLVLQGLVYDPLLAIQHDSAV